MIEVTGLTFGYTAQTSVLENISFTIGRGQIIGLLGPSGAGKSTAQRILTGVLSPYQGSVLVMGRELSTYGSSYYETIGVGFELPNTFGKLTAMENLRFFGSFYRTTVDARALLASVGLDESRNKRVEEFSKGMKMRLNFARALLHDPQILLLDEPTSGLDPSTARLLKDVIIEQRARGKSILLTTHNMHDADELCDEVAFLVDGKIHRRGAPAELKAAAGDRSVEVTHRINGHLEATCFDLDGVGGQPDFLRLVNSSSLVAINTVAPTLEDVFMAATGRRLT